MHGPMNIKKIKTCLLYIYTIITIKTGLF